MNGEICCILALCCPPESQAQLNALAAEIESDLRCDPDEARRHAAWTLKHFDLAKKSWGLGKMIHDIGQMAEKHAKGDG